MASYCNVCRICLSVCGEFMDIFEFAPAIMECAPINIVPGDGFPSVICGVCLDKLQAAQHFRVLCIQSDIILRQSDNEVTIGIPRTNDDFDVQSNDSDDMQDEPCNIEEKPDYMHFMTVDVQLGSDDDSNPILLEDYSTTSQAYCENIIPDTTRETQNSETLKVDRDTEPDNNVSHINKNCDQFDKKNNLSILKVIPNPEIVSKPQLYTCKKCGKKYSHIRYFKKHRRLHILQNYFKCGLCLKSFTNIQYLLNHKKSGCKNGFHCHHCLRIFTKKTELCAHLKSHKNKHKPVPALCIKNNKNQLEQQKRHSPRIKKLDQLKKP